MIAIQRMSKMWVQISQYNLMTVAISVSVHKGINKDELQPRLDHFLDN